MRVWRGGQPRRGVIHYDDDDHRRLPHVVKFSGGRSSGLMLLILLENGLLDAQRGDVVLFTNTSAEHPATYDFVRKMKRVTEDSGIPFFIAQLQTFETVVRGEWRRRLSYRLVNDRPRTRGNTKGYSRRGEVFEETIAYSGMLPTVHTRVCTTLMKMFVTREFLSDWLAARQTLPELGHRAGAALSTPADFLRIHRAGRGTMSPDQIARRWKRLARLPTFRPRQTCREFTTADLPAEANRLVSGSVYGDRCWLFGDSPAPFVTFLGFRAGENARFQRMTERNRGQRTPGQDTQPPGEHSYAPLFNLGIDQKRVFRFWQRQPEHIRPHLPEDLNLSNCVFCFLKGRRSLSDLHRHKERIEELLPESIRSKRNGRKAPDSILWWERLEDGFKRESNTGDRSFGMFGLKDLSYQRIRKEAETGERKAASPAGAPGDDLALSCECTD